MRIRVACYSGYRGEETPRRIVIGDRHLEVVDIIDRWLAPQHRYFKCRTGEGAIWIIRHDMATLEWELTHYKNGEACKRIVARQPGDGHG